MLATEEHAQRLFLAVMAAEPPPGLSEADVINGMAIVSVCFNAAYGKCGLVGVEVGFNVECARSGEWAGRVTVGVEVGRSGSGTAALVASELEAIWGRGTADAALVPLPILFPVPYTHTVVRLLAIALIRSFFPEGERAPALLEQATRWAVDDRLLQLVTGILGMAIGASTSASGGMTPRAALAISPQAALAISPRATLTPRRQSAVSGGGGEPG